MAPPNWAQLDLTSLPRGVHILKLTGDEGSATARIVLR